MGVGGADTDSPASGPPRWFLGAAFFVTAAAWTAGRSRGLPSTDLSVASPGVFLLLCSYFALADPRIRAPLAGWCRTSRVRRVLVACALLALPYLAYALPLRVFSVQGFLALLLYATLPLLALSLPRKREESVAADLAVLLLVWFPLEFRWLPQIWGWPPGQTGHFLDGLLGVILAVYAFDVVRGLPGIGFMPPPRRRDWLLAGSGCLLFVPFAVGFGMLTGFLTPSAHLPNLLAATARILGIFLVTAVPEELLFRGILQNLLHRWSGRPVFSLATAAVVFGAAHLNVGAHAEWRLALLAAFAGVLYGWLYRAGGSLMAPALAHTAIDSIWTLLFRR